MGVMWASCLDEVSEVLAVRPDLRESMLEYLFKEKLVDPPRKDQGVPWSAMVMLLEGDIGLDEAVRSVGGDRTASCRVKCTLARIYNQAVLDSMESMGMSRAVVSAKRPDNVTSTESSQLTGKGYSIKALKWMLRTDNGVPSPDCLVKGNPLCKFVVMPVTGAIAP